MRLQQEFYKRDTLTVAKELLGKVLVHHKDGQALEVIISETEAYKGYMDKACHAYKNKLTKRTEVMFGEPGLLYVYQIYGMYFCMNVVTEDVDKPCAVLIRGVKPLKGENHMSQLRYGIPYEQLQTYKQKNFSNGPGKLCMALGIDKTENGLDLCSSDTLFIQDRGIKVLRMKTTKRINIDYAEEAVNFPWRFVME